MTGFWCFMIGLLWTGTLKASPLTDPHVKNLTLVGVIHVEGARAKGQSVAVLRERSTGKTRILHKGDSVANLEVRELGPQQVTLARGQQTFVLRVENETETASLDHVESTDVELVHDKSPSPVVELPPPTETTVEMNVKAEAPAEQRRLIPDPDCPGEDCPAVPDANEVKSESTDQP